MGEDSTHGGNKFMDNFSWNICRKRHFGDLGADGKIVLKWK
jgi:hypothetical protein